RRDVAHHVGAAGPAADRHRPRHRPRPVPRPGTASPGVLRTGARMSGSTQATSPAPDFTRLYAQLRVAPGCGLAAFKQAYRRRVADLHPDRPAVRPRDPDVLKALNLGYAAALDFHRAHGRLPGA